MAVADFIQAMPKVELNLRLEGAFPKETLLLVADQNEIASGMKHFNRWRDLLMNPESERLSELIQTYCEWLRYPDDLSRLVYDAGLLLVKQNVRYAEISLNPPLLMQPGMNFDQFMGAVNDGRDRVERGWGIRINWLLSIPRHEPRKADEIVRWAVSAAGRRGRVVGVQLIGDEKAQPVGQFERAFTAAHRKEMPTAIQAGQDLGEEGIREALDTLRPERLLDARGAAESAELLERLRSETVTVCLSPSRGIQQGWYEGYANFPIRQFLDVGVPLVVGADMPVLFGASLTEIYTRLVEDGGVGLDELENLALAAVHQSLLPEDERKKMEEDFRTEYARLRDEHITPEAL